jgi:hypothetical protein
MAHAKEGEYVEEAELLDVLQLSAEALEAEETREEHHLEFVADGGRAEHDEDVEGEVGVGFQPFFELLVLGQLVGLHEKCEEVECEYE